MHALLFILATAVIYAVGAALSLDPDFRVWSDQARTAAIAVWVLVVLGIVGSFACRCAEPPRHWD